MLKRCMPAIVLLALSPAALANGVDLNINNDAVRVTVDFELSNNIVLDGSWLYHQDNGNVLGAGLHATGAVTGGRDPIRGGLGARLLYVDSDTAGKGSGVVLPIGGFVQYTVPEYNRFFLGASLYYAPDVLSFDDTTDYLEYNAWAGYSLLRNGQVYLGVRKVSSDFKRSPSVTFDTGLHVGMRLRF